ncbi:YdaF family protein [Escherichia coli]|nr:DUF1391 family protein [Escherichia coli]MDC6846803.1 YdaF family protein [Escherichia coli]MDC6851638.1 YdaF family protein [Escherichia coli]MDC6861429.1 YdaF family protein [Escherichia coli]MDC6865939.1 YdaF family protein [Escherichia coli]HBI9876424.1 DUF1391 family protein [Escherichia coli]
MQPEIINPENQDGTFTAMTYTKSKTFKTENGARRWLERNSGE